MSIISCACGCGGLRNDLDKKGKRRIYILGHNQRGKLNPAKHKSIVKVRTYHERARKQLKPSKCAINNSDCLGCIDAAHLDGNCENNDHGNIVTLCRSHHFLMDKRGLTLDELRGIQLKYSVSSGKRRYR